MLMAAGGVAFEKISANRSWKPLRLGYPALIAAAGLLTLPFGVPVLPVNTFLKYSDPVALRSRSKNRTRFKSAPATELRGHVRMGRPRYNRRARLLRAARSRTRKLRNPGRELRRSRGNRLLRSSVRLAESNRRSQQLFLLGPAPIFRPMRDSVRRRLRRTQELLQRRRAGSHSIPIRWACPQNKTSPSTSAENPKRLWPNSGPTSN